ncbi:MAG: cytochrome c assembly protein [uncultured bacterium]|nr:MAG: cytochrome c assembly protein [uncultured bacterium]
MFNPIVLATLFFYFIGTLFQASVFVCPSKCLKSFALSFGLIAICFHAVLLHIWIDMDAGQNLNWLNLFSTATWLVALFLFVISIKKSIELLILIIFPLNILSIILVELFPMKTMINTLANPNNLFHILLAIFTFCVLFFAGLCSILLSMQAHCIRNKKFTNLISKLPAIESMEILLFQIILLGFILLSCVLVSSFYFYDHIIFSQHLLLKSIITICSWLVFATLLLGKFLKGWCIRNIIIGTYLGVILLICAVMFKN